MGFQNERAPDLFAPENRNGRIVTARAITCNVWNALACSNASRSRSGYRYMYFLMPSTPVPGIQKLTN